jgi:DNA modification methylase
MMRAGERIKRVHPTEKPIALAMWILKEFCGNATVILDLFGGSGSTLIACEQTNRICYMMEIDEKYCDVIRKRYAKFIGKEEEWEKITPRVN